MITSIILCQLLLANILFPFPFPFFVLVIIDCFLFIALCNLCLFLSCVSYLFLFKLSKVDGSLIEHKIKFLISFRKKKKKNVTSNKLRVEVDILEIDFLIKVGAVVSTVADEKVLRKITKNKKKSIF